MNVSWQRVRVPLLERLALLELADTRGISEEEALSQVIREAVKREIVELDTQPKNLQQEVQR